jgi:hypothetical protein
MPASIFGALFGNTKLTSSGAQQPARGVTVSAARTSRGPPSGSVGTKTVTSGRTGVSPHEATSAIGNIFQFTDTLSASTTKTYPLTSDSDWVSAFFNVAVTATGNSTSQDNLYALSNVQILAADGPVMNLTPNIDFYDFAQRFSPLHIRPVQVSNAVATAVTTSIEVYGINLPQSRGPYTMMITTPAASAFGTQGTGGASALSVAVTLSLGSGQCTTRSRYQFTGNPITPTNAGTNDLSPLLPIQDIPLTELFISGMTNNANDINYVQTLSSGNTVGTRDLAASLVSNCNAQMVTPLNATTTGQTGNYASNPGLGELFLLFALHTSVTAGRSSHLYFTWGASPASTIRFGEYWLE